MHNVCLYASEIYTIGSWDLRTEGLRRSGPSATWSEGIYGLLRIPIARPLDFNYNIRHRLRARAMTPPPHCECSYRPPVKENKYSSELEIVVRNSSELEKSPHNFSVDVSQLKDTTRPLITLDQLSECINFRFQFKSKFCVLRKSFTSQAKKINNRNADATGSSKIILGMTTLIYLQRNAVILLWFARIKEVNTSL